jgi:hypothetical protein
VCGILFPGVVCPISENSTVFRDETTTIDCVETMLFGFESSDNLGDNWTFTIWIQISFVVLAKHIVYGFESQDFGFLVFRC